MKTKAFVLLLVSICINIHSQNITNTLGVSGLFTIKDGGSTFLSLNQSTGYLSLNKSINLPNSTSSTVGVIFKNNERFIYDYLPPGQTSPNQFIGVNSGNFFMTGESNTGIGFWALHFITSGSKNTSLGYSSLLNTTTGIENTAIGWAACINVTTGSNLTCIGNNSQPTSATATNQITLGNNQIASLRCNVTTITSLSDIRDKKNISDLSLGIDFLMNLKPRQFNWDKREWYENNTSDGSKMQEAPTAGFIAQELDEVQSTQNAEWLNLVLKDNPDKWEATPGNLLPIMVKAIQELKQENDGLKTENNNLKKRLDDITNQQDEIVQRLEKLEVPYANPEIKIAGENK